MRKIIHRTVYDAFRIALVLLSMSAVVVCLATCSPHHVTGLANLACLLALCNYVVFAEDLGDI
jgi:hypothetical protein